MAGIEITNPQTSTGSTLFADDPSVQSVFKKMKDMPTEVSNDVLKNNNGFQDALTKSGPQLMKLADAKNMRKKCGMRITNLSSIPSVTIDFPVRPNDISDSINVEWGRETPRGRSTGYFGYSSTSDRSCNISLKIFRTDMGDNSGTSVSDYSDLIIKSKIEKLEQRNHEIDGEVNKRSDRGNSELKTIISSEELLKKYKDYKSNQDQLIVDSGKYDKDMDDFREVETEYISVFNPDTIYDPNDVPFDDDLTLRYRNALNKKNASGDLVAKYKSQIDEFEREYPELIGYMDSGNEEITRETIENVVNSRKERQKALLDEKEENNEEIKRLRAALSKKDHGVRSTGARHSSLVNFVNACKSLAYPEYDFKGELTPPVCLVDIYGVVNFVAICESVNVTWAEDIYNGEPSAADISMAFIGVSNVPFSASDVIMNGNGRNVEEGFYSL